MTSCSDAAALRLTSGNSGGEQANLAWLGILFGLFGSIGVNLGQNIQNAEWDSPGTVWYRRWSVWGASLFITAAIVNFVAFAFAPASILAPLEGSQFLSNFLFNYYIERDPVIYKHRYRIATGTALVAIGVVVPVVVSPTDVMVFDEEALKCMWLGVPWLVFLGSITVVGALLATAYVIRRPGPPTRGERSRDRGLQFLYSVPVACVGAFGVVNSKVISEMIEVLFEGISVGDWSVMGSWFLWTTIAAILVGIGGWVVGLNAGPQRFPPLTIIPLLSGLYILLSSIGGGLFFEELAKFQPWQLILYLLGLTTLMVGLAFIVPPPPKGSQASPIAKLKIGAGGIGVVVFKSGQVYSECASSGGLPLVAM